MPGLAQRAFAEWLGTAFLLAAVVGSGIMASRLSPSDIGLQLLENAAATAGALIGLIVMMGAGSSKGSVLHPDKLVILSTADVKGKTSPCG